nr:hypothetical protein DM860_003642 [Ipomoea trifida]GMD18146.1 hypothetical protein DM860_003642 [Ipomoea batatas]GMD83918.1 hypothetical protein DM860_003642 [Ipomoea batatas]GMD87277.1 hypothetical protein DM860_003642 [Ipomoea batatas]GMD88550.1 hypothetical protein DM860_003642 [Ipomoea batatas]
MDISTKLLEHKNSIAVLIAASLFLGFVINTAPRLITMLAYFWPLFLSTTLFMGAIIAFTQVPPFAVDFRGEKDGEGLLGYLVFQQEQQLEDF